MEYKVDSISLHGIDFDLLYLEYRNLCLLQDTIDNDRACVLLEGTISFLEYILDTAEDDGLFTFPSEEELQKYKGNLNKFRD